MYDLRYFLNDNYDHIRPILVNAVSNAIQAMEENEEEGVDVHLRTMIIHFASDDHNDAEAIDNYLLSVNQNSSTRQFFERFVFPVQPIG
jgi:nitrogen-specific signal transduction histidine kinase